MVFLLPEAGETGIAFKELVGLFVLAVALILAGLLLHHLRQETSL